MTLAIRLSPLGENRLREQAAAAGQDLEQYASSVLESTLARQAEDANGSSNEAEQRRLHQVAEELLREAEQVVPEPNPPRLQGRKAEVEQLIVEKFRKRGISP